MSDRHGRLLGALLTLGALLVLGCAAGRLLPEAWVGSSILRFLENPAPWGLTLAVGLGLLAARLGARRSGAALALLSLVAGAAITLDHLRLSLPRVPPARQGAGEIRVLFFNVLQSNTANARAIARMTIALDPDVAIFAEASGLAPARDLLAAHFPFATGCDAATPEGACDLAVYARRPFLDHEIGPVAAFSRQGYFRGRTLDSTGAEVEIFGVHLLKPWFSGFAEGERDKLTWRSLFSRARPALMVGDFNAAPWTHALSDLLRQSGFRAARTITATWPSAAGAVGVPLDHALVRGGMRLVAVEPVGADLGSNHRGLLVTARRVPEEGPCS